MFNLLASSPDIVGSGTATVKIVLGHAASAMSGIQNVGVGIASVFIIFVIFYSVSSILDGGKFQIKMLWPVLIYLCICSFSTVGSFAADFAANIQKQCVTAATNVQAKILDGKDYFNYCFDKMCEGRSITDPTFKEIMADRASTLQDEHPVEAGQLGGTPDVGSGDGGKVDEGGIGDSGYWSQLFGFVGDMYNTVKDITKSITKWYNNVKLDFVLPFMKDSVDKNGNNLSMITKAIMLLECGAQWIIAMVVQWICNLLQMAYICLGAVMLGILVAFGPITWAFAIIPGNGQTIKNWFLRICQYALYSPIVALISAFIAALEGEFMSLLGQNAGTGITGYSVFIPMSCIIVAILSLTAVPSIAASIIEGVSGAVSLSQGINTISSTINTTANVMQTMKKK